MIEMPVFEEEDWYLKSIKSLFAHGNTKSEKKIEEHYVRKCKEINNLLAEVICDKDFSSRNEKYTLFEKLILAPFEDLKKIHDRININADKIFIDLVKDSNGEVKRTIKKQWGTLYQLYDKFVKKNFNTQLVQKYGIKCCPYCNENYIINRKKGKDKTYAMAQLDHFYPRDKFPIFSISLYNLIPSCATCNHIKSTNEIGVSLHDHTRDFSHLHITYTPKSSGWIDNAEEIELLFRYDKRDYHFQEDMEKNLEIMGIKSSYCTHTDYVQELLKKAQIYGKAMRNNLLNDFPELFHSDDELVRIIFSNYIDKKDALKRPLSKLTQDLLKELKII